MKRKGNKEGREGRNNPLVRSVLPETSYIDFVHPE